MNDINEVSGWLSPAPVTVRRPAGRDLPFVDKKTFSAQGGYGNMRGRCTVHRITDSAHCALSGENTMEWMLLPLKRYADFNGRSRRKEYWMFMLLQAIVLLVLGGLFGIAAALMGGENGPGALAWLVAAVIGIVVLALIVPSIAVTVRRLHDQGKSGWFYLISLVPYVGGFIVLVFMCLEGTPGPNEYGENPKQ
ncbi:uncharacterized membrane protein YhaH (DUF805 family) [Xanthomonas arboricola]|nr:uncharacterized membrane protein YhaH (DUF805 family) [Xanthomonas arboricola]